MSDAEAQVTATEYDPDGELRDLLDEVGQNATVSYGEERDLDLSAGIEGFQRGYHVLFDEPYQDLTAEWYRPEAVEMGFPESRLAKRIGDLDHDPIGLGELERYARVWLSAGSE